MTMRPRGFRGRRPRMNLAPGSALCEGCRPRRAHVAVLLGVAVVLGTCPEPTGDVSHVVLEHFETVGISLDLIARRLGHERWRAGVDVPVHVGEVVEGRARHCPARGAAVGSRLAVEGDRQVEYTAADGAATPADDLREVV